jgi:hypothetical protein
MRQMRIPRNRQARHRRFREHPERLPLDPREKAVVRAKALRTRELPLAIGASTHEHEAARHSVATKSRHAR